MKDKESFSKEEILREIKEWWNQNSHCSVCDDSPVDACFDKHPDEIELETTYDIFDETFLKSFLRVCGKQLEDLRKENNLLRKVNAEHGEQLKEVGVLKDKVWGERLRVCDKQHDTQNTHKKCEALEKISGGLNRDYELSVLRDRIKKITHPNFQDAIDRLFGELGVSD